MRLDKFLLLYLPLGLVFTLMIAGAAWALGAVLRPEAAAGPDPAPAAVPMETSPPTAPSPDPRGAAPLPDSAEPPQRVPRYAELELSDDDIDLLAEIVFLEAGTESFQGQQAVAEVILNRVVNGSFPDTLSEVILEPDQFLSVSALGTAEPSATQYAAINAALYGPNILPVGVLYFSRGAENRMVWGTIGAHTFCYGYYW